MKVAIVGLDLAGKTTLFHALTRGQAAAGAAGRADRSLVAVVEVPDQRMDALAEMYQPRKVAPAAVEFVAGAASRPPGVGAAGGGDGAVVSRARGDPASGIPQRQAARAGGQHCRGRARRSGRAAAGTPARARGADADAAAGRVREGGGGGR